MRGDVASACDEALDDLALHGCAAAHYRLTGALLERLCVRRLPRSHRMVVAFPDELTVAVLLVGERGRKATDVYQRLYGQLGLKAPVGERTKPDCCEEHSEPPVDPQLVERCIVSARALRVGRRRQRRR